MPKAAARSASETYFGPRCGCASHPKDTLSRLETMGMMSDVDMPLGALRAQIGSGVQLIVQVARQRDGSRKVTHMTEVRGLDLATQKYVLADLFVRKYAAADGSGRIDSELEPTGVLPACQPQLDEHGVTLPEPVLARAKSQPEAR